MKIAEVSLHGRFAAESFAIRACLRPLCNATPPGMRAEAPSGACITNGHRHAKQSWSGVRQVRYGM